MEPFVLKPSERGPLLLYLASWAKKGGVTAGITSRTGGVSRLPWKSLNVGLHVGDEEQDVVRNRQTVTHALSWPFEAWTCAEQVHGSRVHRVEWSDRGRGRHSREDAVQECDALMTDEEGILLTSFYADCVPLYFYDPARRVVALAHAGWKGTALQIAKSAIEAMNSAYGCLPETIAAAIGPSIGPCCYEVDEPVIGRIEPLIRELSAGPYRCRAEDMMREEGRRARLNLKEINRQIMIKAGILPTNIELTERCTGCDTETFYSHRMEKGRTGRMASWIGMEKR